MTKSQAEIRSIANRTELEEIYNLLELAFPVGRAFFQERLDHDSAYDSETSWIASVQETIVSTVQIFPFSCRIEDEAVKVGGIGSVATHPDHRGQGYCQQILNRQTEWMEQQGYDLSLLFAVITPFYEKLGWRVVQEPIYEVNRACIPTNFQSDYLITPFDPSYLDSMASLYEQFNEGRNYTVIRPSSWWQDQLHWPRSRTSTCLLALNNGETAAYGYVSETKNGIVYVEELCYLEGHEESVLPLFHSLLEQRPEASHIQAKLPENHRLLEAFIAWGAVKKTLSYAMWKVLRFQPLLAKLSSVFQKRLQGSKELALASLQLCLECAGQKAFVHYSDGQVAIEPYARIGIDYKHLAVAQEDFVTMLFHGVDESTNMELQIDVLQALFPKQNSIFYMTDKF